MLPRIAIIAALACPPIEHERPPPLELPGLALQLPEPFGDTEHLEEWCPMPKPYYTAEQVRKIVETAMQVVEARQAGKDSLAIGRVTFDLNERGACNRFVREVHEAAFGKREQTWEWRRYYAKQTLDALQAAGYRVTDGSRKPGDIIGHRAGSAGHIAIYVGDYYGDKRQLVAENSSAERGDPAAPGTKITRLEHMTGNLRWYRLGP